MGAANLEIGREQRIEESRGSGFNLALREWKETDDFDPAASESATFGTNSTFADPVSSNRPAFRSRSTATLMTANSPGVR